MTDKTKSTQKSEYDMAEEVRAFNILLEEMRGRFQLVTEGLVGLGERMDRSIGDLEAKIDARLNVIEAVVKQNSKDIQELQS